jgi:predicted PolB exonuclease-like 3'-5' exonuclease
VVAIGFTVSECHLIDCDGDDQQEYDGLAEFWGRATYCILNNIPMIGWNTHGFDLPFLVRRSWILGVPIPHAVRKGRYWNDLFIDLMQVYMLGGRDMVKLDVAAKAFGLEGKVQEVDGVAVSGKEFHRVWKENRNVAEAYLLRDLAIPAALAIRMGVV